LTDPEEPLGPFERAGLDSDPGLVHDLEPDSPALLIAFGALPAKMGDVPLFEFSRSASSLGVKAAFVRDPHRSWYLRGIESIPSGVDNACARLAQLIADAGVERTVTVGSSAGGYAALLFGHLLEVDEALAFAPQTFLDPALRHRHGENRHLWAYKPLLESGSLDPRYADLRSVLAHGQGNGKTSFHIHYAHGMPLDTTHASHLADLDRVTLHAHEWGGHHVVKALRNRGVLQELMRDALLPRSF
jgi:hypothetical protein